MAKLPQLLPRWFSRAGSRLKLRYLTPGDLALFIVFFNALDPATVRCRFGYLISKLSDEAARKLVWVDPLTEPALAVFSEDETEIHAIGRYYLNQATAEAEIAIVVALPMRRRGLARLTMESLIGLAKERGVRGLTAYVTTSDAPVLRLLDSLGFVRMQPTSGGDIKLSLDLASAR